MNAKTKTSELYKIIAVKAESQKIRSFIDWLSHEKGIELCECDSVLNYKGVNSNIEELLVEYFGIDLKKAESERAAILEGSRTRLEQ